jgi:hypothetical protein
MPLHTTGLLGNSYCLIHTAFLVKKKDEIQIITINASTTITRLCFPHFARFLKHVRRRLNEMNHFLEFFQENDGSLSATRLGFLLWVFGVFVIWAFASWSKMQLQPIDSSVITVIGILMTGKVVQKFGEKP